MVGGTDCYDRPALLSDSALDDDAWDSLLRAGTRTLCRSARAGDGRRHIVNWGVFVIDDGYDGWFIRAIPAANPT
jgi:hypothetical protein